MTQSNEIDNFRLNFKPQTETESNYFLLDGVFRYIVYVSLFLFIYQSVSDRIEPHETKRRTSCPRFNWKEQSNNWKLIIWHVLLFCLLHASVQIDSISFKTHHAVATIDKNKQSNLINPNFRLASSDSVCKSDAKIENKDKSRRLARNIVLSYCFPLKVWSVSSERYFFSFEVDFPVFRMMYRGCILLTYILHYVAIYFNSVFPSIFMFHC